MSNVIKLNSMRDFGHEMQKAAEAHLAACSEAMWEQDEGCDVDSPASAPFCGCDTCVVREVLYAAWPLMLLMANETEAPSGGPGMLPSQ